MTSWSDAGFGLDPIGDARRRAELALARVVELPTGGPRGLSADLVIVDDPILPEPPEGHEVDTGEDAQGRGYARCRCGDWEAVVTGPSSARWAYEQYAEHLRLVASAGA